jgi:ribulose-phosphate 3-epimerase
LKITIEPSILSADLTRLGEQVREAEEAGAEAIQIDVMDGCFVPNITFGQGIVEALREMTQMFLDVHLMIVEPEKYLEEFAGLGADRLIVHQEACPHLYRTLQMISKLGLENGVALNPGTPLCAIEEVFDLTDVVQIMTVNPGFGGQAFLNSQIDKIRRLDVAIKSLKLDIPIIVDGGIDAKTAPRVVEAGATVLVAGSSVFNRKASVKENMERIYKSA